MSFVDFGLSIFPNPQKHAGDCLPRLNCCRSNSLPLRDVTLKNICCHVIVDHLIDLGCCAENELIAIKRELDTFKELKLTDEQIVQLRAKKIGSEDEVDRIVGHRTRLDDSRAIIGKYLYGKFEHWSRISTNVCPCKNANCNCQKVKQRQRDECDEIGCARSTEEESLRASINDKEAKIVSLEADYAAKKSELQEHENRMKKLQDNVISLEKDLRCAREQKQNDALQSAEDKKKIEQLEAELKTKRTELAKLVSSVKNLEDELKKSQQRLKTAEAAKTNQESLIEHLNSEIGKLDKLNRQQDKEIDRFIKIIESLNRKYEKKETDLVRTKSKLETREAQLSERRVQLDRTERETSHLITALGDCLSRLGSSDSHQALSELSNVAALAANTDDSAINACKRASQLTRGLERIVDEQRSRELRLAHRREITEEQRENAGAEIEAEHGEREAYGDSRGDALRAELEILGCALDDAARTIDGFDTNAGVKRIIDDADDKPEAGPPSAILRRVQNYTRTAIRITAVLQEETTLASRRKELEDQLERAQSSLKIIADENEDLQRKCENGRRRCAELVGEMERLKATTEKRIEELEATNEELRSSVEQSKQLRDQLKIIKKERRESRDNSTARMDEQNKLIEKLRDETKTKDARIKQYAKDMEALNASLIESRDTCKRFQSSVTKIKVESFTAMQNKIIELGVDKKKLLKKTTDLELQLAKLVDDNVRLQDNFNAITKDNKLLEERVINTKGLNQRIEDSIARDASATNLTPQCDNVLVKVSELSRKLCRLVTNDVDFHELNEEAKYLADKLRDQQQQLATKDKELADKNKQIEQLKGQIVGTKSDNAATALVKRFNALSRERTELMEKLKQTSLTYEDKLAGMHKMYKQNEIELQKRHNDSISSLEAKYEAIIVNEDRNKMISVSQNWLQTLSPKQQQELHDRICKLTRQQCTPDRDVFEEQNKKTELKGPLPNISAKRTKNPDARNARNASASKLNNNNRNRGATREICSAQSINVAEKDYSLSHHHQHVKNVTVNKIRH